MKKFFVLSALVCLGFFLPGDVRAVAMLTARVDGQLSTSVYQDGQYALSLTNPDGSPFSGTVDVSLKDGSGNFTTPSLFRDRNGNPLVVSNGTLIIIMSAFRNPTSGAWPSVGTSVAKFRPSSRSDMDMSNEITVFTVPTPISSYWPFPPAGTYYDYKEIPGIPQTRFRFDIEKYVNMTGSCQRTGVVPFRMTQTNKYDNVKRFMGNSDFRFFIEWVGDHLHGMGIKKYIGTPEELSTNAVIPRGKLGDWGNFWPYNKTGYTSRNLPSFYLMPRTLDFNFYADDFFQTGNSQSCSSWGSTYKWAIDIRKIEAVDLTSGTGQGNLQAGDLQIRFFEHNGIGNSGPLGALNREDWFLRKNVGVVRIEAARGKYTDECVEQQHGNFSCWQNPSLSASAACNCWSRRIHPSLIDEGFSLTQKYTPHQLTFVVKESGTTTYSVQPGGNYTLKETSANYTGYLQVMNKPNQIWKAYTYKGCAVGNLSCNEPPQLNDMWLEGGEVRIYVPLDFPAGTYTGQFRSHIWEKPSGTDGSNVTETAIEPNYPAWSAPITIQVSNAMTPTSIPVPVQGDVTGDRKVNVADTLKLLSKLKNPYTIFDYALVAANYGKL